MIINTVRCWLLCISVAALTACAPNYTMLERPSDGYDAIRLNQRIIIDQGFRGNFTYPAGSLLVADRKAVGSDVRYYCGIGVQDGGAAMSMCVTYDRKAIAITRPITGETYAAPITSTDVTELKN